MLAKLYFIEFFSPTNVAVSKLIRLIYCSCLIVEKIRLYDFIINLLLREDTDCIRWCNESDGEFQITDTNKVAKMWGTIKNNPTMTYEKMARALRHYYKDGILTHYKHKEKLRYKFTTDILRKIRSTDKVSKRYDRSHSI